MAGWNEPHARSTLKPQQHTHPSLTPRSLSLFARPHRCWCQNGGEEGMVGARDTEKRKEQPLAPLIASPSLISSHSSGTSTSPSSILDWISRGSSPSTVQPTETQVPRISLTCWWVNQGENNESEWARSRSWWSRPSQDPSLAAVLRTVPVSFLAHDRSRMIRAISTTSSRFRLPLCLMSFSCWGEEREGEKRVRECDRSAL